jgi:hypothetical protein
MVLSDFSFASFAKANKRQCQFEFGAAATQPCLIIRFRVTVAGQDFCDGQDCLSYRMALGFYG